MIGKPRHQGSYPDREVDCQQAMEAGFQAIVDCMVEAGWTREEVKRALRRLIAADNMAERENARVEADLAIARAMIRAGRPQPW
ncbi:MAG: hypothetical protein EOQ64_18855 [Mesorhizobium sp.]|uniref:hypothetical protein n=1 Tax=Mesorhizobium sp. TaxID=1871066 RepID=UPI000FE62B4D|nr:hypothetical protein [Mesorhizobium sp.]RWG54845.1 MAG: hypothetical protein EOQ64_18855 [Mesorhizobium sp.]RWH42061.1 MAG: hypothetical protein EOQ78_18015 [Mesorhizobium sp.]